MTRYFQLIGLGLFVFITACKQESKSETSVNNQEEKNSVTVAQIANTLSATLVSKGFKIIADVDHQAGAKKVGLPLRPTRTLIFGNPKGGTLLMQQNQAIGIDLPLKVVVWEDDQAKVNINYYNGTDLTGRYGITEPAAVITKIDGMFAAVTGDSGKRLAQEALLNSAELISKKSAYNAELTFERLQKIVKEKGLSIMAVVPHDKAAASVDLELRPTRLLVFGNPKVGTLLMQNDQRIGLDLPLKVLVHENEAGETMVSYYNASTLARRYGIEDREEVVQKINGALSGITDAVIK